MTVIGPLISKGGNTYKAFVATSIFNRPQDMALYLNCSNMIAKAKISLPSTRAVIKEVNLKVNFKNFISVKSIKYFPYSSIVQLSMVTASLERF